MIIVSACLAGEKCRYDGCDKLRDDLVQLVERDEAIAVCPEQLGGLPTPRPPAEQIGDKVLTKDQIDVTDAYQRGAEEALKEAMQICLEKGVPLDKAILKSNSPMCGVGKIYDGTFSGNKKEGDGVFTKLLIERGIKVEPRD